MPCTSPLLLPRRHVSNCCCCCWSSSAAAPVHPSAAARRSSQFRPSAAASLLPPPCCRLGPQPYPASRATHSHRGVCSIWQCVMATSIPARPVEKSKRQTTHSRRVVSSIWQRVMAIRLVLPVPDCACAMTSRPWTMGSTARCWMADGFSKPNCNWSGGGHGGSVILMVWVGTQGSALQAASIRAGMAGWSPLSSLGSRQPACTSAHRPHPRQPTSRTPTHPLLLERT